MSRTLTDAPVYLNAYDVADVSRAIREVAVLPGLAAALYEGPPGVAPKAYVVPPALFEKMLEAYARSVHAGAAKSD